MASLTYAYIDRLIKEAYTQTGIVQEGSDPTSEQLARGINAFNDLVGFFATKGLKLFTLVDTTVTLVAGTASYTVGATGATKPLSVFSGYYLDSNNNKRPLTPLSWDEYTRLSQVTQQGAVNSYFVDKQATLMKVTFWLVPDATAATGTAHLIVRNQITQAVLLTDTLLLPTEWNLALIWGLADLLCTGQPESIMARCEKKAEMYRKSLEDWDVEDVETRFVPDSRGGYNARRSR